MISLGSSQFLSPTRSFRQLSILLTIHNASETSQNKIAEVTCLSSSMVNNYIKELIKDEKITVAGSTNRTMRYYLTASGYQDLTDSLLRYSAEIVQIYGTIKREILKILNSFIDEGIGSIALFGAAETAEIAYAALGETQITVKGIFDSDETKIGKFFNGMRINSPETIRNFSMDAVLITSYAKQEEIHQYIRNTIGEGVRVKKLSVLKVIS